MVGDNDSYSPTTTSSIVAEVGGGDLIAAPPPATSGTRVLLATGASSSDTLNAGAGNNIMIGEGVNTTFNVDTTNNPSAVDVVWATGGTDTLNVTGGATVYVVDAPDATLASVENLDARKLLQLLASYVTVDTYIFGGAPGPVAPITGPAIIAINPAPGEKLFINGTQTTTGSAALGPGGDLISVTGVPENSAPGVVGFAEGDFGISLIQSPDTLTGYTPSVRLAAYQFRRRGTQAAGRVEVATRAWWIRRAFPDLTTATRLCRSRRRQ